MARCQVREWAPSCLRLSVALQEGLKVDQANHSKLLAELHRRYADGQCSWEEYERLHEKLVSVPVKKPSMWPVRVRSRLRSRCPLKRRRMAYSGVLPPQLACHYTVSQMAVLGVLAALNGYCDLSVAEIAARADVCERTVQSTLRLAEGDGLIIRTERRRKGAKSLTNLIKVTNREWLAWIRKRIGCKRYRPLDSDSYQKGASGPSANHSRAFVAPKREGRGGGIDRGPS
jgi:hypothetical protein